MSRQKVIKYYIVGADFPLQGFDIKEESERIAKEAKILLAGEGVVRIGSLEGVPVYLDPYQTDPNQIMMGYTYT